MKNWIYKNCWLFLLILSVTATIGACKSTTQFSKEQETENLTRAINNKSYVFSAQMALPSGYRNIALTPGYSLKITADTVDADLPYYGRAYSAPMNPNSGGIRFTSSQFEYEKNTDKNGWTIAIKTKDTPERTTFILNVKNNGNTTLRVSENNRQSISFSGLTTPVN